MTKLLSGLIKRDPKNIFTRIAVTKTVTLDFFAIDEAWGPVVRLPCFTILENVIIISSCSSRYFQRVYCQPLCE